MRRAHTWTAGPSSTPTGLLRGPRPRSGRGLRSARLARLVTLTGPGGSGKTRLAEEVAAEARGADRRSDRPCRAASVEAVDLVPGAIGARLGLTSAETLATVLAQLAQLPLLLVLDNLEQLLRIGPAVGELLRGTTALRILATSREPLRISGEHVYLVEPLPVPAADERDPHRLASTPSVALLLDPRPPRACGGDGPGRRGGTPRSRPVARRVAARARDRRPMGRCTGANETVRRRRSRLGPDGAPDRRRRAPPHAPLDHRLEPRPATVPEQGRCAACPGPRAGISMRSGPWAVGTSARRF